MSCQASVDHNDPRKHLMSKHKAIVPPMNVNSTLSEMFMSENLTLTYPPVVPTDPVYPVHGLTKPIPNYKKCDHCSKIYKGGDSNAFRSHVCTVGEKNPAHRTFTLTTVQTFHPNNSRFPWFPVLEIAMEAVASNRWATYQSQTTRARKAPEELSVPDNYRTIHQFLHQEGWLTHVEGKNLEMLKTLIDPSNIALSLPKLALHIEAYLNHYQTQIYGTHSYHVRRLVSTRPRWVYYVSSMRSISHILF